MKRVAFVAAGAAVLGLTACTHDAAPGATPASRGTPAVAAPVSCSQQYRMWAHGEGKALMDAFDAVTSATKSGHAHVLAGALRHARPAVAKATRHPIPACADPRGYWSALLMHVNAAVAGTGRAGVRAALQDVPKIHHQLVAEVRENAQ